MKTTSITVERNFHILNDDRFIMEKISATVELEEDDSPHVAIGLTRQMIENNFRLSYPTVEEHLNFHVVKNYSNNFADADKWTKAPSDIKHESWLGNEVKEKKEKFIEKAVNLIMKDNSTLPKTGTVPPLILASQIHQEEKIEKQDPFIEIPKCKTLTQLKEWELLASLNPKLKIIYEEKMSTLTIGNKTEPTY